MEVYTHEMFSSKNNPKSSYSRNAFSVNIHERAVVYTTVMNGQSCEATLIYSTVGINRENSKSLDSGRKVLIVEIHTRNININGLSLGLS